jgi:hypothetical protein
MRSTASCVVSFVSWSRYKSSCLSTSDSDHPSFDGMNEFSIEGLRYPRACLSTRRAFRTASRTTGGCRNPKMGNGVATCRLVESCRIDFGGECGRQCGSLRQDGWRWKLSESKQVCRAVRVALCIRCQNTSTFHSTSVFTAISFKWEEHTIRMNVGGLFVVVVKLDRVDNFSGRSSAVDYTHHSIINPGRSYNLRV